MPISKKSARLWFGLVPAFLVAAGAIIAAFALGYPDSALAIAAIAPFATAVAAFVYGQSKKGGQIRAAEIMARVTGEEEGT